jgi:hypothetical protein
MGGVLQSVKETVTKNKEPVEQSREPLGSEICEALSLKLFRVLI